MEFTSSRFFAGAVSFIAGLRWPLYAYNQRCFRNTFGWSLSAPNCKLQRAIYCTGVCKHRTPVWDQNPLLHAVAFLRTLVSTSVLFSVEQVNQWRIHLTAGGSPLYILRKLCSTVREKKLLKLRRHWTLSASVSVLTVLCIQFYYHQQDRVRMRSMEWTKISWAVENFTLKPNDYIYQNELDIKP